MVIQLCYIWQEGRKDVVRLLLDHDANTNHPDNHEWTALHVVSLGGHGADAGRPDIRGMLQRDGHDSIVRLLLNYVVQRMGLIALFCL